jgi:outer membrane protein
MIRLFCFLLFSLACDSFQAQDYWDLQRCIDYAFVNNISVQQSRLGIERADISHDQSRWDLLPRVNAGGNHGYNWGQRIDPFTNTFATERVRSNNLFVSGDLDLFNGFNKMKIVRQNEANLNASEYDFQSMQNDIAMQIALAYLQVLLNKENVVISENQVAITQQQADRMKQLVDAGAEPLGSYYDLQSQLAQEELTMINNQNAVTLSRLNLMQLLQLSQFDAPDFEIVTPDFGDVGMELIANTSNDIYIKAKSTLPQVQAAESRRTSAEYALDASRGLLYPTLSLSGALGTGYSGINREGVGAPITDFVPIGTVAGSNETVLSIFPQTTFAEIQTKSFGNQLNENLNRNVFLNLSIPLFNGMAARTNMQQAKVNQVEADLNYSQVTNQLRFDVEQAYTDAKASLNSYMASQKAVNALKESFKYAEARYQQSVINVVDYNNIKTQYAIAQTNLVRSKYDFVFRTKILDFYLGNPITF